MSLLHLYHPTVSSTPPSHSKHPASPRSDALKLLPICATSWKGYSSAELKHHVYDYGNFFRRVRYEDRDWKELSRRELERPKLERRN
ncbi:unnamed protein product [Sphacelaria rigidula]